MPEPIVPPEEIQTIVDKTADFVARLGEEFEKRIFENEKDNPKFSFLKFNDQYFPWYQKRIRDFRITLGLEKAPAPQPVQPAPVQEPQPQPTAPAAPTIAPAVPKETKIEEEVIQELPTHRPTTLAQRALLISRRNKSKPIPAPPPELFTLEMPEDLTGQDVDIIRLTAQFVAKNGHQFQIGLMNREHRNPQFDFLKQNHNWHTYFLGLVEGYTRCLLPQKNISAKLREDFTEKQSLLDKIIAKHSFEKQVETAKKKEEEQKKRDETASQLIDWHDFVVVETINFFDEEELPMVAPETAMAEGGAMNDEDMEMEVDEPQQKQPELKIKQNYVKPADGPFKSPMPPPPGVGVPPPPGFGVPMQQVLDEPEAKRQRMEAQLMPETQFLSTYRGPVNVQIQVPKEDDKPEWKLQGQTITVRVNLTETIQQLKEKITEQIGIPANKQKLKGTTISVLKDNLSVAYYNLLDGSVLQLSQRARGGKK